MSKTDSSEKAVNNKQKQDSLAKTVETLKITSNESDFVPSTSSSTSSSSVRSESNSRTTVTINNNSPESNDADHSSSDGSESGSECEFIDLLSNGEFELTIRGMENLRKDRKNSKIKTVNKKPVPIQPKLPTAVQPQMVIVKLDPNGRYRSVTQDNGVIYLYPTTDNIDMNNQATTNQINNNNNPIDNMIPSTSTATINDPTLDIPQSTNPNINTYVGNNQHTQQTAINEIKQTLQSSVCQTNDVLYVNNNNNNMNNNMNNGINHNVNMNLPLLDESFQQLPINSPFMPNMHQAPPPQQTFYPDPVYNSNPVSPQTPRFSEPNVGATQFYATPFSPPQENNFIFMSSSEGSMSSNAIQQLLNSPINSPSDSNSMNRSRQIIQINATPQIQTQLYTQICSLETAKISDLSCIVKLKKDNGNTFIHQLAALDLILHNLSKQTVQVVLQYDNPNNQYARLPTQLFMIKIIERAIRDEKRLDKTMLLYQLLNARNDNDETPLHIAVKYNRSDFVRLLIEHNALPNIQTKKGYTALHQACAVGAYDSLKVLIDYYYSKDGNIATINQLDCLGNTPLALAIINHNTDVEIQNKQPYTIKSFKIIEELMHKNANTRIRNHENNNLVHLLFQNIKSMCEDRIRILNYLRITKPELTDERNIYNKNAWECWSGIAIYEKPEQLLQRLEGYQMQ